MCDTPYFRQLFFRKSELLTLWKLGVGRGGGVYPQIFRAQHANFKELRRGWHVSGAPSNPASAFSLQMCVCVWVYVGQYLLSSTGESYWFSGSGSYHYYSLFLYLHSVVSIFLSSVSLTKIPQVSHRGG